MRIIARMYRLLIFLTAALLLTACQSAPSPERLEEMRQENDGWKRNLTTQDTLVWRLHAGNQIHEIQDSLQRHPAYAMGLLDSAFSRKLEETILAFENWVSARKVLSLRAAQFTADNAHWIELVRESGVPRRKADQTWKFQGEQYMSLLKDFENLQQDHQDLLRSLNEVVTGFQAGNYVLAAPVKPAFVMPDAAVVLGRNMPAAPDSAGR